MAQPVFQHPEIHFIINETPTQLILEVETEWSKKLEETLKGLSGTSLAKAAFVIWTLPKSSAVIETLTEVISTPLAPLLKQSPALRVPTGLLTSPYPQKYPRVVRGPAPEIKSREGASYLPKGYRVYDYTEKSIVIIPDPQNRQAMADLRQAFERLGCKWSRLYPEGTDGTIGQPYSMGYVVAKSHAEAMAYVSELCEGQIGTPPGFPAPKIVPGPTGLGRPLGGLPGIPNLGAPAPTGLPLNIRFESLIKDLKSVNELKRSERQLADSTDKLICFWGPAALIQPLEGAELQGELSAGDRKIALYRTH